jgi:predicted MFS family arabinose efflux permease
MKQIVRWRKLILIIAVIAAMAAYCIYTATPESKAIGAAARERAVKELMEYAR